MSLMQALIKIKNGLEKKDLQEIADGYEILSGEKILFSNDVPEPVITKKGRGRPKKSVSIATAQDTNTILLGRDKKPNKFVDDGTLHAKDKEIDALIHNKKPVNRRPPAELITITCDSCNKPYTITKGLFIKDSRHYCNNCCRR